MEKLISGVLEILRDDCRYSAAKIATMLGADEAEVSAVITQLEAKGIIAKYTAVINDHKLGVDNVEALIEVKVTPQQSSGFDAIAEELCKFDEVKSLFLMSGAYDLAVMIEGKNLREVAMFVSEKLSTVPSIIGTATHFILKKYKSDSILLEDFENTFTRIAVQP